MSFGVANIFQSFRKSNTSRRKKSRRPRPTVSSCHSRRPCSYRLSMPRFRRRQNRKSVSANIKNEFDNMNDPTYKEHFHMRRHRGGCGRDEYDGRICRQFPNRLTNIFGISKITKIHPKSTLTALNRRYPIYPARHSGRGAKAISAFFCKVSRPKTSAGRGGKTQNKAERMKRARAKRPEHTKRIRPDRNAVRQGRIHLPESARHAAE